MQYFKMIGWEERMLWTGVISQDSNLRWVSEDALYWTTINVYIYMFALYDEQLDHEYP